MRYFIRFSYDGSQYHGWQRQPNALTVQQVLEEALTTLLRVPVSLVAAGRTDSGVHAREMYAHTDLDPISDKMQLQYRLNALLPEDIAIRDILPVSDTAHARFDAVERTYEYWIIQEKDPFLLPGAYYLQHPIHVDAMNQAASILREYKDFRCFSRSNTDVKTFLCDIREARWEYRGPLLVFTVSADRFLRNMVRAMVGTLLEIGKGRLAVADVNGIIKSRDRRQAGVSVPAKGLYLTRVCYPESLFSR